MSQTLLKDLHDGSDLWNVYQKAAPSELFCISLLLVDVEGNKIQASFLNKGMHNKFSTEITEENTYEFSNFIVSQNSYKYRATVHPFKLTFTSHTSINKEDAPLPLYAYSFKSVSDILNLHDNDTIDYLFDFLAFVHSIGTLEEIQKDNETKYRMRMVLQDAQGNDIECVLWDSCASDAYLAQMENHDTPVVILLHLARLGTTDNNRRQICSSFNATRALFNPTIKEVYDLIESVKDRDTPMTTTFSQSIPSQMSQVSGGGSLHNSTKLTISQIKEQKTGSVFVINCEVHKFESKHGWIYDGCSKCSSKPRPKDVKDPNSPLICSGCKKAPASTEPKMKLHYIVKDETGSYSVLFWDKLAVQLLNKTALQLKLTTTEKKTGTGFPKEVEDPVGLKLLLKLKLNDYNKNYPGSSISVCEFVICEDLLNEFNAASVEECLQSGSQPRMDAKASSWASGFSLRKLFVTMLLCGSLQRPHNVWKETSQLLSEDLLHIARNDPTLSGIQVPMSQKEQAALREIDGILKQNGKSLHDYSSLPIPDEMPSIDFSNHMIIQELSHDRQYLKIESEKLLNELNSEQRNVYDHIMASLHLPHGGFFFVYGYGGTGKTFLWNSLASTLRAKGDIVLTVASSGIAATLLPSGRTAHSRFAIPIQITESSTCSIWQNSPLANLIKATKLIIWDEVPMVQHFCIEAFDRSLKDIMQSNRPFGGKCLLMGGDFRQILPVIPKGTRAAIVNACISSSHLWQHCKVFHLTRNMRLRSSNDPKLNKRIEWFSNWLLDVGDGNLGKAIDGVADIEIPDEDLIPHSNDAINAIVQATYTDIMDNLTMNDYFNDRAILAPTIDMVNKINDHMCSMLPGEEFEFLSCDTMCKSTEDSDSFNNLYTTEFLNTISSSGLPPHRLVLKVGAPIMLLRNIDQASGLYNGTRLRVSFIGKKVIEAITLNGSRPN